MAIPSFYHPSLTEHDTTVCLDPAEAAHAVKARRLKLGQELRLFNGLGLIGFGQLSQVDRRSAEVEIHSYEHAVPKKQCLSIAVAIPKGDRQKVMLDMLTQLGVSEIIPIRCDFSVTKFSPNMHEKWQKAVIEAAKQSQNPFLPRIKECVNVAELIEQTSKTVMVANEGGDSLLELNTDESQLLILIGPEGGFSDAEFAFFKNNDLSTVQLGGHILRTEAAAIAAASQFNLIA